MNFKGNLDILMILCYNLAVLSGTACLVEVYEWSAWWFLAAFCCLLTFKETKDTKD